MFYSVTHLVSRSSAWFSVFLTTWLSSSPLTTSLSWCSGTPRRQTRSRQSRGNLRSIISIYIFLRQILTFWTIFCDILKSDSCTIFTRPKLLAEILQFKYGRDHLVFWLWQSWSLMNVTRAKRWAPRFEWSPECTIQYKKLILEFNVHIIQVYTFYCSLKNKSKKREHSNEFKGLNPIRMFWVVFQ